MHNFIILLAILICWLFRLVYCWQADKAEKDRLPAIPFHGLRHTKATLQIAAGTDIRTVSAILGHRETSTTMDIYSHSLQTAEQEAANKIEQLLEKQA